MTMPTNTTPEQAGRCGHHAPHVFPDGDVQQQFCRLPAGHAGWHKGDDDSEWTVEGQSWHDAGLAAWYAWDRFSNGHTPVEVADAITAMSNAISDLGTFLPGYDYETGTIADGPSDGRAVSS